MSRQYTRRTSGQWLTLVEAQKQSGLSAPRYCEQHELSYASFCKWRQRFAQAQSRESGAAVAELPDFVDFSELAASAPGRWHITLSLGDGVELKLSRD
jgi:hypothetical protein